jgi:hypothetical protein
MASARNSIDAWKTAKGVGLCFVVSLAAGWLTRELLSGKVDPANKIAACILDVTLVAMLAVLTNVGTKKWRNHQLTQAAKRILVLSVIFLIVFFVVGWRSDLSLK